MPIYTYQCDMCGHKQDEIESIKTSTYTTHPCPTNIIHGVDASKDEGYQVDGQMCTGTMRRVPSVPAPAKFRCSMPTAPTKHHKHGR